MSQVKGPGGFPSSGSWQDKEQGQRSLQVMWASPTTVPMPGTLAEPTSPASSMRTRLRHLRSHPHT